MAKVKITGHASGSGVFTITAPNSNTDRVISLPDATATIATTTDVAARLPSITDGGNATAMTITSAENVGIGTASPQSLLHIKGGGIGFHIESDSNSTSRTWGLNTETVAGGDLTFQYGTSTGANPSVTSLRLVNDGRGLSQFTAKAWVTYKQETGSGYGIQDSHNVSSVTDRAAGKGTMNFANAMGNTNYCVVGNAFDGNGENDARMINHSGDSTKSTSAFDFFTGYPDASGDGSALSHNDAMEVTMIVFGD